MLRYILFATIAISAFSYGALVGRHEVFPFPQIVQMKRAIFGGYSEQAALNPRLAQFDKFSPQADVVLVGDSLTERGIWNDIFPKVNLSNRGLGGDTANGILSRLDSIRALNPKSVLIMVGINDLRSGSSTSDVFQSYKKIVETLREDGTQVIIQSTIECEKQRCGDTLDKVRDLNRKLREYSTKVDLKFANLNKSMADSETGLLPQLSKDGIHLSAEGYVSWAKQIESFIVGSQP